VPPISGAATAVFHRYYDEADLRPNYVHHREARRRREAAVATGRQPATASASPS
jgi:nitric-oxide synthase